MMQMYPIQNAQMMNANAAVMNQLPFPHNAFVTQPMQPNIAAPIFNTSVSNDPGVNQYSNFITWGLANEIVTKAANANQGNVPRIFGYNMYSQNDFNNGEFLELAKIIAERVRLGLLQNQYQNIEVAISALVPETYTIACGANIRRFPALQQFMTQNMFADCMQSATRYDSIIAEINGMNNLSNQSQLRGTGYSDITSAAANAFMPSTPMNTQKSSRSSIGTMGVPAGNDALSQQLNKITSQQTPVQQGNNLNPYHQRVNSPIAYAPTPTIDHTNSLHLGANAPAYQPPSQSEFERQVQEAIDAPRADLSTMPPDVTFFTVEDIKTTPEDISEIKLHADNHVEISGRKYKLAGVPNYGEVEWEPSALQPYFPSVNLSYQVIDYIKLETGEVLAYVHDLPKGKYHMDYDKHATNGNYGTKPPVIPDTGRPLEKPKFIDIDPVNMSIGRSVGITDFTSIQSALTEAYMSNYVDLSSSDTLNATINEVRIIEPVILPDANVAKVIFDEVINIRSARDFQAAALFISNLPRKVSEIVNDFITRRVNTVVRFELSMAGDPITSFVDDYAELIEVIETNYAGAIASSIVDAQNRIIRSACTVVNPDAIEDVAMYFNGDEKAVEETIKRTIFVSRFASIAIAAMRNDELALYFHKESQAILENKSPQLREIAEHTLNTQTIPNNNIAEAYIVTIDGFRYRVARSLMQGSAVLISRA